MKKYIPYLFSFMFLLSALSSCQNSNPNREHMLTLIEAWQDKEIIFPHHPVFTILGQDTLAAHPVPRGEYAIVTYADSTGCMSCKLQLLDWEYFIEELNERSDSIPVYMFLNTRNKEEMAAILKQYQFRYPVCLDLADSLNILNRFDTEMPFQTFLLDKNNRVVAMGNPIHYPKIRDIYFNLMFGDEVTKPATEIETTVSVSDSLINTD